jgi:hypothetical protein
VARLQLLTIAELLEGKRIEMLPAHHDQTLKRAPKAKAKRGIMETELYQKRSD